MNTEHFAAWHGWADMDLHDLVSESGTVSLNAWIKGWKANLLYTFLNQFRLDDIVICHICWDPTVEEDI